MKSDNNDTWLIEIGSLSDSIESRMFSQPSSYLPAKKRLEAAKMLVISNPKGALKQMRKAYFQVEKEYGLMRSFSKTVDSIPVSDKVAGTQVESDMREFRNDIRNGNYKAASKVLKKLERRVPEGGISSTLFGSEVLSIEGNKVRIKLFNRTPYDMLIRSVKAISKDTEVVRTFCGSSVIKGNDQAYAEVDLKEDHPEKVQIVLTLRYEQSMKEFAVSETFTAETKAEE